MTEAGGEQFSQGRIQCECKCSSMGGISAAGWVVISLFLGLVVGSVVGILTALWLLKKREKEKREAEALNNWRIVGRPGTIAAAGHPGMRPPPSQVSATEEFNFAPMSMHKHKLLTTSNGFELQSLQASHLSNPFPVPKSYSSNTPHSSMFSRHDQSPPGDGDPQTTVIPIDSSTADQQQSQQQQSPLDESENEHSSSDRESRGSGSDSRHMSDRRAESEESSRRENLDPAQYHGEAGNSGRLIRQYTRTSSGLDEEVLSSIHSLGALQILNEYAMTDLNDDWKEILGAVDRLLADQGEPPLDKRERSMAMKALLSASESDGVDLALEGALTEVLNCREDCQDE
ncbi:hypothetical protein BSKO_03958 [Bryopsis sp. KO-2023]|nr:hypothetical protein BSKO_03958 [Bryopsis sp. KO-2023]